MSIDPIVWYIVPLIAVGLLISFAIRRWMRIRAQKKNLWSQIHRVLDGIHGKQQEGEGLWLKYRLLLQKVKHPAERIVDEVNTLHSRAEDQHEKLQDRLFGPVLKWKLWANFAYEEGEIPDRFYKEPKNGREPKHHSVDDLEELLASLKDLDNLYEEFIERVGYATSPLDHTGGLTPIEFRSTMLEGQEHAEELRQEERALRLEYFEARETLAHNYTYLQNRQNPRSLREGEPSATGSSERLTFEMIEDYWETCIAEVDELEEENGITKELVEEVLTRAEVLKQFPLQAKRVAETEQRFKQVQQEIRNTSQMYSIEVTTPAQLENAEKLLDQAPEAWGSANWKELEDLLNKAHINLRQAEDALDKLLVWSRTINRFARRLMAIERVEKFLDEAHEVQPRNTTGWQEHEEQEEELLEAWANIDEAVFNKTTKTLEDTLDLREQMLVNRMGEIVREKRENLPQEAIEKLQKLQSDLISKSEDDSSAPGEREDKSKRQEGSDAARDVWAPEPGLSGEMVEVITETGIPIMVDKSMADDYQRRWSVTPEEDDEDEGQRPESPMNGFQRASKQFHKRTKEG